MSEQTFTYKVPDGGGTPDASGQHTATVNVMHSARQYARFPGCEQCRRLAQASCPRCYHIPCTTAYSGWNEATETFATAVHHGPGNRMCGDSSCELCAKYAAGWCQSCGQFTRNSAE